MAGPLSGGRRSQEISATEGQVQFNPALLQNIAASDAVRALVPQQGYPPGATPLQRRQADDAYQRGVLGLVVNVSNNDRTAFQAAARQLGVSDTETAYHDISREMWSQFGLESQRRCAEAQWANNREERQRQFANVSVSGTNLANLGVENAQSDMVTGVGQQIAQQGRARGMSEAQIHQQQEDMLLAAQSAQDERRNPLFSMGTILAAANNLGISMTPSQSKIRDPEENEAQTVFDAIRINAILMSRDIMRKMSDIDHQLGGNLDARTRREKEEEYAELSRQLTRLMGRESPNAESQGNGQVRIATADIPQIVDGHMRALMALHSNPAELDQITPGRRQATG